ncbi:hypothetical protein L9F63_016998 [Diploptera punctata]|uniref:C2H2-type domain-containing protein n=1 Tax=Diploptera punctata TaxID=6984 RepID=A0AAD7ZZM6_DIPPU|nr:hypothetical protein L9F63_016998 [Diploptera punctata]
MPPFMPPPPGPRSFPPGIPRPPMPMLRGRPGLRPPPPPGLRPPLGVVPPMRPMGRIARGGKRIGMMPNKGKAKTKKATNPGELQENELNKPWITDAMKNEIMKKHKLYQKAKKSNAENDWKEFKDQKTRVAIMIREAKIEYIGSHPEEGNDHYCETCDREFNNASKLAEHIEEHSVCGLDGCRFVAHPKVIENHVKMQHETGLYKKIGNIYTPEDIANWIAERKRLYPTKENIVKRNAELAERMQRGERLSENKDRFGKQKHNKGRKDTGFQRRGKGRGGFRNFCRREFNPSIEAKKNFQIEDTDVNMNGNLPRFPAAYQFQTVFRVDETSDGDNIEEVKLEFSDAEWEVTNEAEVKTAPEIKLPVACKALTSLMFSYASDVSDSQDESEVTVPAIKPFLPVRSTEVTETNGCKDSDKNICTTEHLTKKGENIPEVEDSDDGPDEAPVLHNNTDEINPVVNEQETNTDNQSVTNNHSRKRRRHHKSNGKATKIPKQTEDSKPDILEPIRVKNVRKTPVRKLTLLEKLLSSEIRHERNVILQCVRYTVQNKFFAKENVDNDKKKTNILLQCIRHLADQNFNLDHSNFENTINEKIQTEPSEKYTET